jgi:hypothetical protein
MKKYLFTPALLLAVFTGAHAQNYIGGNVYVGGPLYDASTTSGSQIISGSNIDINTGGTWMFNDANVTTLRTNHFYFNFIAFKGGNYSRTTGYVNGYADAEGQPAGFILPIGESSYMPLTINTATTSTRVQGAWYDAKPLNSTFIIEAGGGASAQFDFLPGYYDLFTSDTFNTSVKPTLPNNVVAATHLLGTKDGTNFTDLGLANTSVALKEFFYQLRFANKGVILPLTVTSFSASKQNNITSLLTWKISTEQNIATYSVERSNDGRNFSAIGSVASLGNTLAERTYTFADLKPFNGANYYRLKIIEKDGEISYTAIRIVNWSNAISVAVFPNPVKNTATVTGLESNMLVTLLNQQGQVIEQQKAQGNTIHVPMDMLAAGTYHIQVSDKNGLLLTDQKIVKQ